MSIAAMRIKQLAPRALAGLRRLVTWVMILAVLVVGLGSVVSGAAARDAAMQGQWSVTNSALVDADEDGDLDSTLGSGCVLRHTGACMQLQAPSPEFVRVAPCTALCEAITWQISDALVASGVVAPPSEPPRI